MAGPRTKYDPLEAAKISAAGKPVASEQQPFKSADPVEHDLDEVVVPSPITTAPRAPIYRVLEACRVSCDGQIVKMPLGHTIDSAGYGGEPGIARLRAQGLKLEIVSWAMPFNDAEKERIRYHMGYLQVNPAAALSYGIPMPIQTMFLLESAMDRVIPAAEDRVRKLITTLDNIECREEDALNYLVADQLQDLAVRKDHIDQLENQYCSWASKLADTLGCPLYPGSTRFRKLFGTGGPSQAGSIPVRNG